ncbi:MAG: hypothetical protein A3K19_27900 [Lentisphaerae bacterium RIFOXYB12_FULL_65_16]|nr:MAG: hypothetical protein A3K18_25905 [Lentisphaerae bacterium RIFOXYA12_64_32]OGV88188.1 MAG: hypothetical protein A3K19_27900 [Lentisphaerae bacterium RIFOXYB12_FULL_65_16]
MTYFDDFRLLGAFCEAPLGRPYNQGWPDLFSVQFVFRGEFRFGRDGAGMSVLTAPVVYWIEPRHTYQLEPTDGADVRHVVLFRGERGRRIVEHGFDVLSARGWLPVPEPEEMDGLFRALARPGGAPSVEEHADAAVLLDRMLGLLLLRRCESGADRCRERMLAIAEQIRAHPFERHDPRDLAERNNMSYTHFRRLFKACVQRSPHEYVLLCRMQAAARQLRDPGCRIKEVARLAGYERPADFSRAFKRQMGLAPRQLRSLMP